MLLPSNHVPLSSDSLSLWSGIVTLLMAPSMSENCSSTSFTFSFFILSSISRVSTFFHLSIAYIGLLPVSSWYASALCSDASNPFISSSSDALKPITTLIALNIMSEAGNTNRNAAAIPVAWLASCEMPPPNSKPFTPPNASSANKPTASVPHAPHTPCTEIAPTGSSTLIESKNFTAATTIVPPIAPIIIALSGLTFAVPAVIETKPASAPLSVIPMFGFELFNHVTAIAAVAPAAAASVVVTAIAAILAFVPASVDPALNPYHPNHKMKTPSVAKGSECPFISTAFPLMYFPILGPTAIAPASAAQPPTLCTTVEPAKSMNGASNSESQPPPQAQCPTTGYIIAVIAKEKARYAENRVRSAMAPETIVAAVAANTT